MSDATGLVPAGDIGSLIRTVRGQKVVLDGDLARASGLPFKRLNDQAKRNADGFPPDFMFRLSREESEAALRPRSRRVFGSKTSEGV